MITIRIERSVCFSFIMIATICALCGCKSFNTSWSVYKETKDVRDEIHSRFESRDVDGLYEMFSETERKDKSLHSRIETLLYCWDLLNLDDSNARRSDNSGGKTFIDGEFTQYEDGFTLDNYYDKNGNAYRLAFYITSIDKSHPENVGLRALSIISGNTEIYGTGIKEKRNGSNNDASGRMNKVINDIYQQEQDTVYASSDDSTRIIMMKELLNNIIESDKAQNTEPIILPDSIEETTSNDGYGRHPALQFCFCDGSSFKIIVHNNP